jgi:DNA replication protein DnaC
MNAQMMMPMSSPSLSLDTLKARLRRLNLYGLLAHAEDILLEPWCERVLALEESERQSRSLKRRLANARVGSFKSMADFDYDWPKELDRALLDELFTFGFLEATANIVIVGPNGLGKTMIAKNLLHQAVLRGLSARFTAASDMLHDLAAQDSSTQLARRLRRYTTPAILCVDEVGYLSYDARYADLLFEVITRRYQQHRPVVLTTNKSFREWNEVFPNAACVVALVDRLVHRSEILNIAGDSYRLKEAQERAAQRASRRNASKKTRRADSHAAQ